MTLWHADADKRARDRQMPRERSQPSRRPSANSLTLVPAGTTEYIAAGDSQAAVPLPRSRKGFRPSMKDASRLSCLLLQLGSNDGEASLSGEGRYGGHILPEGRYHVETLIWTDPGLGQYYIRLDPGADPT